MDHFVKLGHSWSNRFLKAHELAIKLSTLQIFLEDILDLNSKIIFRRLLTGSCRTGKEYLEEFKKKFLLFYYFFIFFIFFLF